MATLTETAYYTRRGINWIIIGIFGYIALRIFWGIFLNVFLAIFPPKLPPPNNAFNKLPAIKYPEQTPPASPLQFRLDTISGSLPKASESAAVYFMPKTPANLLALTKTQEFAKRLDFDINPIAESKNIYRFEDPDLPLRRLRYDIVSNNFILRYLFEQDPNVLTGGDLPLPDVAKSESKNFLQLYNLMPEDLAKGESKVSFLKLSGSELIPTTSLSQGDAVRIDYFRKPLGNTKIYTPYPDEGEVTFIFSGARNARKRIVQIAYTFWPIEYDTKGTYALKTPEQAWQELQNGGGYIARYPARGDTAVVRTITLGYYDSFDPQTYLQPIFVFEGDDGFLGYVTAVAPPWTE